MMKKTSQREPPGESSPRKSRYWAPPHPPDDPSSEDHRDDDESEDAQRIRKVWKDRLHRRQPSISTSGQDHHDPRKAVQPAGSPSSSLALVREPSSSPILSPSLLYWSSNSSPSSLKPSFPPVMSILGGQEKWHLQEKENVPLPRAQTTPPGSVRDDDDDDDDWSLSSFGSLASAPLPAIAPIRRPGHDNQAAALRPGSAASASIMNLMPLPMSNQSVSTTCTTSNEILSLDLRQNHQQHKKKKKKTKFNDIPDGDMRKRKTRPSHDDSQASTTSHHRQFKIHRPPPKSGTRRPPPDGSLTRPATQPGNPAHGVVGPDVQGPLPSSSSRTRQLPPQNDQSFPASAQDSSFGETSLAPPSNSSKLEPIEAPQEDQVLEVYDFLSSPPPFDMALENQDAVAEWSDEQLADAPDDVIFGFAARQDAPQSEWPSEPWPEADSLDDRHQEVDPSLYLPLTTHSSSRRPRRDPIVHYFSLANRPLATRQLLPVAQVFPAPVRSMWAGKFDTFNQLQSEMANMLAYSDDHAVVAAPTGAGKTVIFEMAMARFFTTDLNVQRPLERGTRPISKQRKIVYVSPSKALCEERFQDWSTRWSSAQKRELGLEVVMITGDGDPSESFRDLASAHVIVTTPEKWDSLTRRWTESFYLFSSVKLFLVDEVHLVADGSRGSCLESIVCRMKSIQSVAQQVPVTVADLERSSYPNTSPEAVSSALRIVAVSATLPNIADIASFLGANEAHVFDESYRPVPLTTHVIGQGFVGEASNQQFRFWSSLDRSVPEIIHRFSKQKPTIIFCHSKADTEKLADLLAAASGIGAANITDSSLASQTKVSKLQRVLLHGVAYHHAGLEASDRKLVEKAFLATKIRALCATSTLAMGVNLPAHLVIVKGTKTWSGTGNGYRDIDQASLMQMIGRAGRPGFDTSGTAVIMTDNKSKAKFEKLASSGLNPAQSQIMSKLDETMNAEISQSVITSVDHAVHWLQSTLLFAQMSRDPGAYGINLGENAIEHHLEAICHGAIARLQKVNAVSVQGRQVRPLVACHVMSQHLVDYEAMELLVNLPFDASQCRILQTICAIQGLQRPVRRSEKKILNEAHHSLKYKLDGPPSKVRIQEPHQKAFVLLQASIGRILLQDYTLRQEMNSMVDYASRMLSALEEYSIRGTKHGMVTVQALKLRRSLATSLWSADDGILNQVVGVGLATTFSLKLSGISSFDDLLETSDDEIEKAAKRPSPFGKNLRLAVTKIAHSALKVSGEIEYERGSKRPLQLALRVQRRTTSSTSTTESTNAVTYTLIAYSDQPGGCLHFQKNISSPCELKTPIPSSFGNVSVHLISSIVGLDEKIELQGNSEVVPSTVAEPNSKMINRVRPHTTLAKKPVDSSRIQADVRLSTTSKSQASETIVTPSPKASLCVPISSSNVSNTRIVDASLVRNEFMLSPAAKTRTDQYSVPDPFLSPPMGYPSATNHQMAGRSRTYDLQSIQGVVGTTATKGSRSVAFSSTQTRSWLRDKGKQQKAQQRAFFRKRDNPFSLYKHDPNDAESYLDSLSSRNKDSPVDSIIPRESLLALENAYKTLEQAPPYNCSPVAHFRKELHEHQDFIGAHHETRPVHLSRNDYEPGFSHSPLHRMETRPWVNVPPYTSSVPETIPALHQQQFASYHGNCPTASGAHRHAMITGGLYGGMYSAFGSTQQQGMRVEVSASNGGSLCFSDSTSQLPSFQATSNFVPVSEHPSQYNGISSLPLTRLGHDTSDPDFEAAFF